MKDSIKANLIIFCIIAIVAFSISSAFAGLTVKENNESYKLIPIENDSFEPNYVEKVPTYVAPVKNITTNTTNTTNNTHTNSSTNSTNILRYL